MAQEEMDVPANESDISEDAPAAEVELPTEVAFEHSLFTRVDEGVFRLSPDGTPVFAMRIGDTEATLPLTGIRREFQIDDESPDAVMLGLVTDALKFVKALQFGDPIPKELLTGEPSWDIQPEHRILAQQRLSMQLVTWVTGEEVLITDPTQLLQVADDENTKKRINEAIGVAAQELGFGDDKEKVLALIEDLSEDLAPIEALRDKFSEVLEIRKKVLVLRKLFGKEMSSLEIADSVARLMEIAVAEFSDRFTDIDANTSEIISALRNISAQKEYIREQRDDLYCRLFVWDETLAEWRKRPAGETEGATDQLRDTYRFLAPRYMAVDEWVLMSQLQAGADGEFSVTEVLDRDSGGDGKLRTGMSW
jgi:hypothetical protein